MAKPLPVLSRTSGLPAASIRQSDTPDRRTPRTSNRTAPQLSDWDSEDFPVLRFTLSSRHYGH